MKKPFKFLFLLLVLVLIPIAYMYADITSDLTTGTIVIEAFPVFSINGGAVQGNNLFHSFSEFSLPNGRIAYFNNGAVDNIISRVTGGTESYIDGLIQANGSANLYMINPSGIIMGENSALNIGGSFHLSTADYLKFGNGDDIYYSSILETSILSTDNPAEFGFLDPPTGDITVQDNMTVPLMVQPGNEISFTAHNINLNSRPILAPQGMISIDAVNSSGEISLTSSGITENSITEHGDISIDSVPITSIGLGAYGIPDGTPLGNLDAGGNDAGKIYIKGKNLTIDGGNIFLNSINDPDGSKLQIDVDTNVYLRNGGGISSVNTTSGKGADITINCRNLRVFEGSQLTALSKGSGHNGNISINADYSVRVYNNNSVIQNISESSGNAGDIRITADGFVRVYSGGTIQDITKADGNCGEIKIETPLLNITEVGKIRSVTLGNGNAGDINIETTEMGLDDRSKLQSLSNGSGNAGNLDVKAEKLTISNTSELNTKSGATGNSGNITIEVDQLVLQDHGQLDSSAFGTGNAGTIIANSSESILMDEDGSYIDARSYFSGTGGNIEVKTDYLEVKDGAKIISGPFGSGNGGDINIDVEKMVFENGGIINMAGVGSGDCGTLNINADSILFTGVNNDLFSLTPPIYDNIPSGIVSYALSSGNGGAININTSTLTIKDGAGIGGSTVGSGKAADINIIATDKCLIEGRDPGKSNYPANINSATEMSGNAGNIKIETPKIIISNGGTIRSTTGFFGKIHGYGGPDYSGHGGLIDLSVKQLELLKGGLIISSSGKFSTGGAAGPIQIAATESVIISGSYNYNSSNEIENSGIYAYALSTGNAYPDPAVFMKYPDSVYINSPYIQILDHGKISAYTSWSVDGAIDIGNAGSAGVIRLNTDKLVIKEGSKIISSTENSGHGGLIDLNIASSLEISGNNSGLYSDSSGSGNGGNITISSTEILIADHGKISAKSTGSGNAGEINITASDSLLLDNSEITTQAENTVDDILTDGGEINITVKNMVKLANSKITAEVKSGSGSGGNITIDPVYVLLVNSSIIADAYGGPGGNIYITAQVFLSSADSMISASSQFGLDGNIITTSGYFWKPYFFA